MPIELPPDVAARLKTSIKQFCAEHLDQDIGDLKAELVLDFCLREVGPSIYNYAIADAQKYFESRVFDLDGVCHQPEFQYWK